VGQLEFFIGIKLPALVLTKPLTEKLPGILPVHRAYNFHVHTVFISGSLNLLEPSGPDRPVQGPLYLLPLPMAAAQLLGEISTGNTEINWQILHIIFLFYFGNY